METNLARVVEVDYFSSRGIAAEDAVSIVESPERLWRGRGKFRKLRDSVQ